MKLKGVLKSPRQETITKVITLVTLVGVLMFTFYAMDRFQQLQANLHLKCPVCDEVTEPAPRDAEDTDQGTPSAPCVGRTVQEIKVRGEVLQLCLP